MGLYGVEDDAGLVGGLSDQDIRDGINGLSVYIHGRKFVVALDTEPQPEQFFFPEERAGESHAVSAYIDGQTIMVLARWGKVVLDIPMFGTVSIAPTRAEQAELDRALESVRLAMGSVDFEVRGGGK